MNELAQALIGEQRKRHLADILEVSRRSLTMFS